VLVLINAKKKKFKKRGQEKKRERGTCRFLQLINSLTKLGIIKPQNMVYKCKYYVVPPHDFGVTW